MSNSSTPRKLVVKKLPKGIFTWKVVLQMGEGHRLGFYDRYYGEQNPLTPAMAEYLRDNVNGRYSIHYVENEESKRKDTKKVDYILFDNQIDVTMFKLCHGHAIRRIYKLVVEEKAA